MIAGVAPTQTGAVGSEASTAPVWVGATPAIMWGWDVKIAGKYAYVADTWNDVSASGLHIVDVETLLNLMKSLYETPGEVVRGHRR